MNRPFSRRLGLAATVLLAALGTQPGSAAADLDRYVALGDGLTAGFADGGLRASGQAASYPKLLSEQARGARSVFEQPVMTEPGIPAVLAPRGSERSTLTPRKGLGSPVNLTLPRPYDNLAVPGAKVGDVLRTRTDGGGLSDLILRGLGTQLEQALLLEPTFASVWLGPSDVLSAAITGIVLDGVTLTPVEEFARDFSAILQALVAGGVTGGAVATVPDVTTFPFVSALPTILVNADGEPELVDGARVPLLGSDGPLSDGDYLLLTASRLLARGDGVSKAMGGSGVPLPDDVVLNRLEAAQLQNRVADYNDAIRGAAADVGFAVVETAALFDEVAREGILVEGRRLIADYPAGGFFSLDGLYPSAAGQALIANAFAAAVNATYGGEVRAREVRAPGPAAAAPELTLSRQAFKNLRFGMRVPKVKKVLRLKRKAERRRELENQKREHRKKLFEMPPPPQLAGGGLVAAL